VLFLSIGEQPGGIFLGGGLLTVESLEVAYECGEFGEVDCDGSGAAEEADDLVLGAVRVLPRRDSGGDFERFPCGVRGHFSPPIGVTGASFDPMDSAWVPWVPVFVFPVSMASMASPMDQMYFAP